MRTPDQKYSIKVVPVKCCICNKDDSEVVGSGYDFEYHTSPDWFYFHRCHNCGLLYLNPRPDVSEFDRIYPPTYHTLNFSEKNFGFVHNFRSRLEANRLLKYCKGLPNSARILDMGCGDGFHLRLIRKYGNPNWSLEGTELDKRAVKLASKDGLTIHYGSLENLALPNEQYDLVYSIHTIDHVAHPDLVFKTFFRILKPGGRLVVVTDNTETLDFSIFKDRYWGGYHFPRHWNLFHRKSLSKLARQTGFDIIKIKTIVSPVNWVYSFHNYLVDRRAPQWLLNFFSLKSSFSLAAFTLLDVLLQKFGKGALLSAYFTKPNSRSK